MLHRVGAALTPRFPVPSEDRFAMLLGSLLVLLVLVCIALSVVILLQRSEGGALGMGGGPSGFMTARGAGDLLTRTTGILAGVFFFLCLLLTVLSARLHAGGSVVDRLRVQGLAPDALNRISPHTAPAAAPAATVPAAGGAANIGAVTPPPPSSFDAPRPEVHTAPSGEPAAAPPAGSGARRPSTLFGVQTAPQSSPTVAPLAKPAGPPPAIRLGPVTETPAGNTTGGQ